jgi:hypothetical protein
MLDTHIYIYDPASTAEDAARGRQSKGNWLKMGPNSCFISTYFTGIGRPEEMAIYLSLENKHFEPVLSVKVKESSVSANRMVIRLCALYITQQKEH